MRKVLQVGLGSCMFAALALMSISPAEAKCVRVKGDGIGVDKMMAMGLAKVSLDTSLAFTGAKPKGKVHYVCKTPFLSECVALQRACT